MPITISVYRFDPENDKKPRMQDYELDPDAIDGVMLLSALEHIRTQIDPTLALRRSCGEGNCGSDGMSINGVNGLACITRLRDLGKKIVLRPLPGLPVIRDLIVDMSQFYKQYERAEPYLQTSGDAPAKERLQSIEERSKLDGLYECILCACCTSSCPSYWWNPKKFMGPAALLWSYRFIVDSRDQMTTKRLAKLQDAFSLFRCRTIMNCAHVCPKGLNPAKAIGETRLKMMKEVA